MKKWTKELLEENGYEIKNAKIESVRLTMADHGVLTSDLVLNGHGWGVAMVGMFSARAILVAKILRDTALAWKQLCESWTQLALMNTVK